MKPLIACDANASCPPSLRGGDCATRESVMFLRRKGELSMSRIVRRLRSSLILAVATSLLISSTASAATVSNTYSIHGYEYYATSTQGRFGGTATGSSGDTATWNAVVNHTPLTTSATITGGYADLVTSNLVHLHGTFAGGSVTLEEDSGCGTQTYAVVGTLKKVTRSDSHRKGTGTFNATLTHYRTSILGSCFVYSASVTGVMTLSF
jgi:hypothetical protein